MSRKPRQYKDLGQKFADKLIRRRTHKRNWPVPSEAKLILAMHFNTYSFGPNSFHAEMTLEIPMEGVIEYYSISAGAKTRAAALRLVIEQMESSFWFNHMRKRGVRFAVTGAGMEQLYHGYI